MQRLARRLIVTALTGTALLAGACTTPPTTTPPDGGPIPSGETFRSVAWQPEDAEALVEAAKRQVADPEFAESLDPASREQTLTALEEQLADPQAVEKLRAALETEKIASAKQQATGRLPAAPSKTFLQQAGAPAYIVDGKVPPPSKEVPAPVPSHTEGPVRDSAVIGSSPAPEPARVIETTVTETRDVWPAEATDAWPVAAGTRADKLSEEWATRPGGADGDTKSVGCSPQNTGDRTVPFKQIPAFRGRIYTPIQSTFASDGRNIGPNPGQVVPYQGDIETRIDPATGVRQMKVEAHLISPTLNPITGLPFELDDFRGHIVVEQLDHAPISYFPGSPNTEWKVLCYSNDAGQSAAKRGYVRAWIPMASTATPPDKSARLDEPGFQIRFETVDNYWDASGYPKGFYSADQVTVIMQGSQGALTHSEIASGGTVGIRVDDGVLVNRDSSATNDLESLLKSQVQPAIGPAIESFQGNWFGVPALAYLWLSDIDANSYSVDLDLKPIYVPGTLPFSSTQDDEYQLTAKFSVNDIYVQGVFGVGLPCYFHTHLKGDVSLSATVDRDSGNVQALKIDSNAAVSAIDTWGNFASPLPLLCNLFYLNKADFAQRYITRLANEKLNGLLDTKLGGPIDLNLDEVLAPGITLPNGNGFGVNFAGFDRTCDPRGCDGGEILLDDRGIAVTASVGISDKKGVAAARRFPLVYDPTLPSTMQDRYMSTTRPDGTPYKVGAFVHPAVLNGILRALTEGTQGFNGLLDLSANIGASQLTVRPEVAPIFVNEAVVPGQPALTVFLPDLRISDGNNEFAVNAVVGVDLEIDTITHKLIPSVVVGVDVDTISCNVWSDPNLLVILNSYSLCAAQDWAGGQPPLIPSVPDIIDLAANTLVPALISNSIGQVELPSTLGFDFLGLGGSGVDNVGGFLSLFVGVPPASVTLSDLQGSLTATTVTATPVDLPGTGDITYDWLADDVYSNAVLDPAPGTSSTLALPSSGFGYFSSLGGLRHHHATVTVTASRGGVSTSAAREVYWFSFP